MPNENKVQAENDENRGKPIKQQMKAEVQRFSLRDTLTSFGHFLSEKIFSPAVLTVFLTAILGPIAIKWVNDGFENKKLQKEVIQTIIAYTNEADFSKPESIEKIAIISQMVNENREIFGLTFDHTNEQIRRLNEAGNDVGIKNLTKKKEEYEQNIKVHQAAYEADTIQLTQFQMRKEKLTEALTGYTDSNNSDKIKETQNKLALVNIEIEDVTKDRDFRREQMKYWKSEKATIEKYIDEASKDMAKMMNQQRNTQELLKKEKGELQKELAKALGDNELMLSQVKELQRQLQTKTDSVSMLKAKRSKETSLTGK
ncbi:MAG: hypothetical protein U9N85_07125 [Bacteroidota bacterium]|nr:hypothetical protein [Bacteroidota bacterium]